MTNRVLSNLMAIQRQLKAPKNQRNKFGNYNYRSCEDILEAVKPFLVDVVLTITDDIVMIGDRFYVKATATLTDGENSISNTAFAREEESKKGMDGSQVTGAASSYARKYALNGLFAIDDNKDADDLPPPVSRPKEEIIAEGKKQKDLRAWFKTLSTAERSIATEYADEIKGKQVASEKPAQQFDDVEDL